MQSASKNYFVGNISVEIERKNVRRFNLRIRRDGTAHLSIPKRASFHQAQDFLDAHVGWLSKAVDRVSYIEQEAVSNNENVPLWGDLVVLPKGLTSDELYRQELEIHLPLVVSRMEQATGLHATGWQIRAMTSRWGSCTPQTGRIRINLRLAAYPAVCLDYVVAHELTHLAEPSHNARFHRLLQQVIPNERQVRALLRMSPRELAQNKAPLSGMKSPASGRSSQ